MGYQFYSNNLYVAWKLMENTWKFAGKTCLSGKVGTLYSLVYIRSRLQWFRLQGAPDYNDFLSHLKCGVVILSLLRSKDDPFMIYAALFNGPGTCIVTRDELRNHYCLMEDMKFLFRRWQRQHQIHPLDIRRVGKNLQFTFQVDIITKTFATSKPWA